MRETEQHIRTPLAYKVCDGVTEALIYFSIVFTPWAFGTTQNWSIWTMNVVCYFLGATLVTKWVIRWRTGYQPWRWGDGMEDTSWKSGVGMMKDGNGKRKAGNRRLGVGSQPSAFSLLKKGGRSVRIENILTWTLAVLTLLILVYCLVSAVNARARFIWSELRFEYNSKYVPCLPHSYDSARSWMAFYAYLGLACAFWGARDWLLTKSDSKPVLSNYFPIDTTETGGGRSVRQMQNAPFHKHTQFPPRLQRLLWIISINGALLALQAMLQRLSGTNKLLWLIAPQFLDGEFGPFAYRSNAAQFLNLTWPTCVGLWLTLATKNGFSSQLTRRIGSSSHFVLLPCIVLAAAAPIICRSRAGALITCCCIIGALVILAPGRSGSIKIDKFTILCTFLTVLGFAAYLGTGDLRQRLEDVFQDSHARIEIYNHSLRILKDFPLFGTGPGTFAAVYFLYKEPRQEWQAYVHNDWLETVITFGVIGSVLIFAMLAITIALYFTERAAPVHLKPVSFLWLSLAGCLLHAIVDLPFQIYSILFLFIILCAILACVSKPIHLLD